MIIPSEKNFQKFLRLLAIIVKDIYVSKDKWWIIIQCQVFIDILSY